MHHRSLFRRRAVPSLAMAALLVPVAGVARRDVTNPFPPRTAALHPKVSALALPPAPAGHAGVRLGALRWAAQGGGGDETRGREVALASSPLSGMDTIPLPGARALAGSEAPADAGSSVGEGSPSVGAAGAAVGATLASPGSTRASPDAVPAAAAAARALSALTPVVRRSSHPEALRTAFDAYFKYRAQHPGRVKKPYLYFVDLGLDNVTARGYVFDMERLELVEGPFMVSHGHGSAGQGGVPANFSNRPGSNASSLGLYLAAETYGFSGKSGGVAYRSIGLRLDGESPGFNDAARRRGIVAHGAPYVTATRAGRSEGCPAMEPPRAQRLLPLLANGGVVFVYSPNDPRWLRGDPWLQAHPGY